MHRSLPIPLTIASSQAALDRVNAVTGHFGLPPGQEQNPQVRAVVQRVSRASVTVAGEVVGSIQRPGLCALVGVTHSDTAAVADKLAEKLWGLRILDDEKSCSDLDAPLLIVSQFTLYGDARKGRRPSWIAAA